MSICLYVCTSVCIVCMLCMACMRVCICMCVRLYVCMCVLPVCMLCVYVYVCMCVCVCACILICLYVSVCMCVCLYVCMLVCLHVCVLVCVFLYACMRVCVYVGMCVIICVRFYVCMPVGLYLSIGLSINIWRVFGTLRTTHTLNQCFRLSFREPSGNLRGTRLLKPCRTKLSKLYAVSYCSVLCFFHHALPCVSGIAHLIPYNMIYSPFSRSQFAVRVSNRGFTNAELHHQQSSISPRKFIHLKIRGRQEGDREGDRRETERETGGRQKGRQEGDSKGDKRDTGGR